MKRLFGMIAVGIFVVLAAQQAHAATYTAWHPNCQDSATDKAECVLVKVELYNSQGNNIEWDRMHAYRCRSVPDHADQWVNKDH